MDFIKYQSVAKFFWGLNSRIELSTGPINKCSYLAGELD